MADDYGLSEPIQPISIQTATPKYNKANTPLFMPDGSLKNKEASVWLDTKINFLNEVMKFLPRNVTDTLTKRFEGKNQVNLSNPQNSSDGFAESIYNQDKNANLLQNSLWKGTQSEIYNKIFDGTNNNLDLNGDGTADVNLSRFTGLLGVPYDGTLGVGTVDGQELTAIAGTKDGSSVANLQYSGYSSNNLYSMDSTTNILAPVLTNISGQDQAAYFREGVDFHPTVVDMQHTALTSDNNFVVDMNGDGVQDANAAGKASLSLNALGTSTYAADYLSKLGVTSPVVDYSSMYSNFMAGSKFANVASNSVGVNSSAQYTYNKALQGLQDSTTGGDFESFLSKIKKSVNLSTDATGSFDYVQNIYELARSGTDFNEKDANGVSKWTDKDVFYMSMLMMESKRRYTEGMASVFGVNSQTVNYSQDINKYANPDAWKYDEVKGMLYLDVVTGGKAGKMYNYFVPDAVGQDKDSSDNFIYNLEQRKNAKINWLRRRAIESEAYQGSYDLYRKLIISSAGSQLGSVNPTLSLNSAPQNLADLTAKLNKYISAKDDLLTQSANSSASLSKVDNFLQTVKDLKAAIDISLVDPTISISDGTVLSDLKTSLTASTDALLKTAASALTSPVSLGGPSQTLLSYYLGQQVQVTLVNDGVTTFDGLESKQAILDRVNGVFSALASKQSNSADFSSVIKNDLFSNFSGENVVDILQNMTENSGRIFKDIQSIDNFNKMTYGQVYSVLDSASSEVNLSALNMGEIGYAPDDIMSQSFSSTYLSSTNRTVNSQTVVDSSGAAVANNFSTTDVRQVDRMYLQMINNMQKMNSFYMMQMFASPDSTSGTDFLKPLQAAAAGMSQAKEVSDATLKNLFTGLSSSTNLYSFLKDTTSASALMENVSGNYMLKADVISIFSTTGTEKEKLTSFISKIQGATQTTESTDDANLQKFWIPLYQKMETLAGGVDVTGQFASNIAASSSVQNLFNNKFGTLQLGVDSTEYGKLTAEYRTILEQSVKNDERSISTFVSTLNSRLNNLISSSSGTVGSTNAVFDSSKMPQLDGSYSNLASLRRDNSITFTSTEDSSAFSAVGLDSLAASAIYNKLTNLGYISGGKTLKTLKLEDVPSTIDPVFMNNPSATQALGLTSQQKQVIVDRFNNAHLGNDYLRTLYNDTQDPTLSGFMGTEGSLKLSVKNSIRSLVTNDDFLSSISNLTTLSSQVNPPDAYMGQLANTYNRSLEQIQTVLNASSNESSVKAALNKNYLNEFYMKDDYSSLSLSSELTDNKTNTLGWYQTDGRYVPTNDVESVATKKMDFANMDYNVASDLSSQIESSKSTSASHYLAGELSNSVRSKRQTKVEDFYNRISASYDGTNWNISSGFKLSGNSVFDNPSDSSASGYYQAHIGTSMKQMHLSSEMKSYFQEVTKSNLFTSIYNDELKAEYNRQTDIYKQEKEKKQQEQDAAAISEQIAAQRRAYLASIKSRKK